MRLYKRLALVPLLCLLAACGGSVPVGKIDADPLPAEIRVPCPHPAQFFPPGDMNQAQSEIAIGRMGDALLRCGAEKAVLLTWAQGVIIDLKGQKDAD